MIQNGHRDVTVQVPTAQGVLKASAPDGDVTADDIIKYQAGLLAASDARVQEIQLALNTITNLAGCAIKFMMDKGYGDEDDAGKISFSKFFLDQMKDCSLTVSEDFAGGYTVRFSERAEGHLGKGV